MIDDYLCTQVIFLWYWKFIAPSICKQLGCNAVENGLQPTVHAPYGVEYFKIFHVFSIKIATKLNHLRFPPFNLNNL